MNKHKISLFLGSGALYWQRLHLVGYNQSLNNPNMLKKLTYGFLGLLSYASAQAQTPNAEEEMIYHLAEEMPIYPNTTCAKPKAVYSDAIYKCAQSAMLDYITRNIKYPEIARANEWSGVAVCSFVVEKDGTLSNIKADTLLKGECQEFLTETLKMLQSLPQKGWTPAKREGKVVRVKIRVPMKFVIKPTNITFRRPANPNRPISPTPIIRRGQRPAIGD
jgi:Gram-negative bacterial TonB protein C-terminal